MVDVSDKSPTLREAEAYAFVAMSRKVLRALPQNPKGDPLEVARIAGIQAAKRTAELIPMCHPLPLSKVDVGCALQSDRSRNSGDRTHHGSHRRRDGGAGCGVGCGSDGV